MKCQVNSYTTHDVLISKEISWKSYKEICSGEKKKVNLAYRVSHVRDDFVVKNNSLVHLPRNLVEKDGSKSNRFIYGLQTNMAFDWEVLSKFFSLYNIEPNWLDCGSESWGYDVETVEKDKKYIWNGCIGKV